ncbi:hypothetical protein [Nesterenkonia natronophila]|uniref:Uncharacterized protein n=1 Tax=Nesterenkonia natronophila TaxID=2174932 RepID=A0A3A4FAX2_9MICC|nr:hypothetical protein [Nesterenkonia natronophila]RJN31944.1 hypothetical protein D3250_07485 [Nesterenkonia natronophila]
MSADTSARLAGDSRTGLAEEERSERHTPDLAERAEDELAPEAPAAEESVTQHRGDQEQQKPTEETAEDTAEDTAAESSSPDDSSTEVTRAEPPTRPGTASQVPVASGPDKSLGGFFDTLDERAKNWWSTRKVRLARRKAEAAKAAENAPEDQPTSSAQRSSASVAPSGTVARRARRSGGQLPTHTPQVSLPKPPPAEQRPEPQLFTDAIPVVSAHPAGESQEPPPPPARRELDEQRQRTVIAQKAAAIEKATGQESSGPYGGSGHIGSQYRKNSAQFADDEEDLYTYIPPYNLPSRSPDPEPTHWDLARRIFVSLGALTAVLSTLWMFGWLGYNEEDPAILGQGGLEESLAGGWFSGEHALLSPDYNWYWIWPVITVGLIIHACYQWTPAQHSTPRQQRSGWLVGIAAFLMLGVTTSLYAGLFTLTLLSSVVIAGVLTEAVRQFNLYTARTDSERQLTDDIVGLFYGFALIQVMSALSVWLTQQGWHIPGIPALLWAWIGLLLCVWTAAFYSMTERGRITIALALAWGLFWLIFPRILGEVTSVWVALGAAMGAFIVILATQSRRYRINHAERRAAMGRPLEDII